MMMQTDASFPQLMTRVSNAFQTRSSEVHTEKWQGMDISRRPEMMSYELLNYFIKVPLHGIEDLQHYRDAIQPNLPWADDHFLERVCGAPINPGVEWKNWPWERSSERFMGITKPMPPQDWAYLAGIIDGEGSFSIRTVNAAENKYPRIKITQVDHDFLELLWRRFGVGTFREYTGENALSDRTSWIWRISAKDEVRWIIEGCLPYLHLKKQKALECLSFVKDAPLITVKEFNHNYMQRYWPRQAGHADADDRWPSNSGIRLPYGDMTDLINLLVEEPTTRQAWIPIFFPEDTGKGDGGRKPCTLGYQFIMRNGQLHVYYPLRSCDFVRHFRDDIYLTVRLLLWVLEECRKRNSIWNEVVPGTYSMHCTSLHIFKNDWVQLFGAPRQ